MDLAIKLRGKKKYLHFDVKNGINLLSIAHPICVHLKILFLIKEVYDMQYESLQKLYYKNPSQFEEIFQSRYNEENTLRFNFQINGNPAFLVQNYEIFKLLLKIHKEDKEVRVLREQLPLAAVTQFSRKSLVDEIVLTNDIEGVNSTRREISDILEKLEESKEKKRFDGLIKKYVMLEQNALIEMNTCEDIRKIYDDLVLQEVAAENKKDCPDGKIFRKDSVSVTDATQKEIHRGLSPETTIIEAMEKALAILNCEEIDLILRVCVVHYLIGYIHPFYDGNGRLSRFISSYMLSKELDPLIGFRISYTIKDNIKQYYRSFKVCNDPRNRGDVTPFVISFLEIIDEAMTQLKGALLRRAIDFEKGKKIIDNDPILSHPKYDALAYILLQAGLFSLYGISTKELCNYANISYATMKSRLEEFKHREILEVKNIGKERRYKLDMSKLK